jgi:hypothetical protein
VSTNLYSQVAVAVNGAMLLEESKLSLQRNSGANPVFTLLRGFAGMSIGAGHIEADITSGVPIAGIEFDPGTRFKSMEPVEVTFYMADLRLTSKGFFTSDSFANGVNAETTHDLKFFGELASWEPV